MSWSDLLINSRARQPALLDLQYSSEVSFRDNHTPTAVWRLQTEASAQLRDKTHKMVFESSIYPFISVASPAYQDAQHRAEHTRIRLGIWMMLKSLERQSLSANHFQSLICSYLHYKLNPAGLTRRHLALCWRPRSDRELRCPSNLFTSADRPSTGCLKKKKIRAKFSALFQ